MTVGIGIDLIELAGIRVSLQKHGGDEGARPLGWQPGTSWKEIEVVRNEKGRLKSG